MNFFPFHLGDYAAHTAHLEPMEDLAYRRMLDLYYLREEPLPADPAAVARLVRMRANVADVEAVLQEFFVLGAQGWAHARCDVEISRAREKLDASGERDQHEKDRMQRYRERRAEMFAALRERGLVPAWDVAMKDLQRLFDDNCNTPVTPPATPATEPETHLQREQAVSPATPATEPETHLQREQAVSPATPATAIYTNTNTNTNTNTSNKGESARSARPPDKPGGVSEKVWSDWLQLRKTKRAPVTETVLNGAKAEAVKAGMSLEDFLAVWCTRGSQGLQAEWLMTKNTSQGLNKQEALEKRNQAVADELIAEFNAKQGAENATV